MIVFAFDRDLTVNVNEGPVPLVLVKHLAHNTEHEVWATGNQLLKAEAGIPGIDEMCARIKIVRKGIGRERRLEILKQIFPDPQIRIVVDDFNLAHVKGWIWLEPNLFVELVNLLRL